MNRPLFSVVVPTRNRARLLGWALQSALDQTFTDYEIVVSDNCSHDSTGDVVRNLATSGIRYVRMDRPLSISDHWEVAVDQARGEYVTFLCDDDAWHPRLLARVADIIHKSESRLIVPGTAVYFGDNWFDTESRNSVYFTRFSGKAERRDSRRTLTELFKCGNTYEAPRMLNSFCRRDLIPELRREASRVFLPSTQDYAFAALSLAVVSEWIYLDEPLRLQGIFAEGIGSAAAYNRGEPLREYVREFGGLALFDRVPLQAPVVTNYIANTLLLAKALLPSRLSGCEIDWPHYFSNCWSDLQMHERNGVNVEIDKAEFAEVLARQDLATRDRVDTIMNLPATPQLVHRPGHPLKRLARRVVNRSPHLRRWEATVRGGHHSVAKTLFGSRLGFNTILECATQLPSLSHTRPE